MLPATRHLRRAAIPLSGLVIGFVICAVITACAPVEPGKLVGAFSGMLPCADCAGIHLELTLYSDPAAYNLKQTYEAAPKGNITYMEKGTWIIRRGSAKNPHATVYELHPAGSDSKQFYLRVDKNTLRLLDRQKEEIPSQLPHTLKRVK